MEKYPLLEMSSIEDAEKLQSIINDKNHSIYFSFDWSEQFYIKSAMAGFISTATYIEEIDFSVLLPEMQEAYALLDWKNLYISKKNRKMIRESSKYHIRISRNPAPIVKSLQNYHNSCWLDKSYSALLSKLSLLNNPVKVLAIELINETQHCLAGELGYQIGGTYTSLSGFCDHQQNGMGTLQLLCLAEILKNKNFLFWNLGHPYMKYKIRIGAKVLERKLFLDRWNPAILDNAEDPCGIYEIGNLFN